MTLSVRRNLIGHLICLSLALPALCWLQACTNWGGDQTSRPAITYPVGTEQDGGQPLIELANAELGIADRCISCHKFESFTSLPDPRVESTWEPRGAAQDEEGYTAAPDWLAGGAHPGGWLRWHPPQVFGCTPCHGGDGRATAFLGAGHRSSAEQVFDVPVMLDQTEMQARCGACHIGTYLPGAEPVWRGRALINDLNCTGCHDLGPKVPTGRLGPSLARVGNKLSFEVIASYPNNVQAWVPGSRMPQFRISDADSQLLARYLTRDLDARPTWPEARLEMNSAALEHGLELIRQAQCVNCHNLPRPGNVDPIDLLWSLPQGEVGPDLASIAERLDPGWTTEFLSDPQAWYPETRMPAYPLPEEDRLIIAHWLDRVSAGRSGAGAESVDLTPSDDESLADMSDDEAVEQGRQLFVSLGCAGCHGTDDEEVEPRNVGPSLAEVGSQGWELFPLEVQILGSHQEYFNKKLENPGFAQNTIMPQFDLSEEERGQLAAALLAQRPAPSARYIKDLSVPSSEPFAAGGGFAEGFWAWPLPAQGAGPVGLSRFERDLGPDSCLVCHRTQFAEWEPSRHADAMSPGMTGQMIDLISDDPGQYRSCMKCHARLEEQNHVREVADRREGEERWEQNPHFRADLYETAHGCANCHVRAHTRYSLDPARTEYLWNSEELLAHELERAEYLSSSEFCKDCHQFDTDSLVPPGVAPRENTYIEWQEWYEQAEEPQTCQECHMPDGDHSFKGIHDADYVQDNVTVTDEILIEPGSVNASLTLENTGGGHHLPTYITPKIYFRGYLADSADERIEGTFQEYMLGRYAELKLPEGGSKKLWIDNYDTRIPAQESYTYIYSSQLPPEARFLHLEIFVAPDDFYHILYTKWKDSKRRSDQGRGLLSEIWEETKPESSGYLLFSSSYSLSAPD